MLVGLNKEQALSVDEIVTMLSVHELRKIYFIPNIEKEILEDKRLNNHFKDYVKKLTPIVKKALSKNKDYSSIYGNLKYNNRYKVIKIKRKKSRVKYFIIAKDFVPS